MQKKITTRPAVAPSAFFSIYLCLLLAPAISSANPEYAAIQPTLDLTLPSSYTAPPPEGVQHDLNVASNIYQGSLGSLKLSKKRVLPLGLKRIKVDKTLKVRGWQVKDNFFIGHARVGKEWGIGMMMTSGNFAYGLNNKGVGMTYKTENSRYRINMREISMKIEF